MKKPLFVPLMKKYYLKFESGEQDCEIRPNDRRGWSLNNVSPGRLMTLSCGYGKQNRITKPITRVKLTNDLKAAKIPQWHIDAVKEIYPDCVDWLIAYVGGDS